MKKAQEKLGWIEEENKKDTFALIADYKVKSSRPLLGLSVTNERQFLKAEIDVEVVAMTVNRNRHN